MRWVLWVSCWICLLGFSPVVTAAPFGYLYPPAYTVDPRAGLPLVPYVPQPGDLILASNTNWLWTTMYGFAGTGKPGHAGVILSLPDGSPAVLEAGANCKPVIGVTPLTTWLGRYKGTAWIRRRKTPLTSEQSCLLTQFALLSDKKPYAVLRLLSQLTPFKTRGAFRTEFVGKPHGIRRSYFCSELVLEALVYAGILDRHTTRPTATYPRDMFYDFSHNPYIDEHLHLECQWEIPALWIRCLCGRR